MSLINPVVYLLNKIYVNRAHKESKICYFSPEKRMKGIFYVLGFMLTFDKLQNTSPLRAIVGNTSHIKIFLLVALLRQAFVSG